MNANTRPSPADVDAAVQQLVSVGFDEQRTRKLVERILVLYNGKMVCSPDPALASCFMDPDAVLDLFEATDLNRLVERQATLDFIFNKNLPFYTLPELKKSIDNLLLEHKEARATLITGGLPSLKEPEEWPGDPNWVKLTLRNLYYTDPIDNGFCTFSPTLSDDDREFIWSLRNRFYNLKVDVLSRLSAALDGRGIASLYDNCMAMIRSALPIGDVDRLLSLDSLYRPSSYQMGLPHYTGCGGLTDLLTAIGFVTEELAVGTHRGIREVADNLRLMARVEDSFPSRGSYYHLVKQSMTDLGEQAYKAARDLLDRDAEYWVDLKKRMVASLDDDFDSEVIIRTRVKTEHSNRFQLHLENYLRLALPQLEITGELPCLPSLVYSADRQKNIIRRDGDYWTIQLGDESVLVKDSKGVHYIHYLIQNQGKSISATRLAAMVAGAGAAPDHGYSGMSAEELEEYDLREGNGLHMDPIYDELAMADLEKGIRRAQAELAAAERSKDPYSTQAAKEELSRLTNILAGATGINGRPRFWNTDAERARKAVSKAIGEVIRQRITNPLIAKHFEDCISRGRTLEYAPQPPVPWEC